MKARNEKMSLQEEGELSCASPLESVLLCTPTCEVEKGMERVR